jgi:hypothetical protein
VHAGDSSLVCSDRSGTLVARVGVPLADAYLEFLGGRCRPNTVRAAVYDLKVFFSAVGKPPHQVRPVDVLAFITAQRTGPATGQDSLQVLHEATDQFARLRTPYWLGDSAVRSMPWPASSPRPSSSCPRPSTTPATRNSPGPRSASSSAPPPPPQPAATETDRDQLDNDHRHNAEMSASSTRISIHEVGYSLTFSLACLRSLRTILHRSGKKSDRRVGAGGPLAGSCGVGGQIHGFCAFSGPCQLTDHTWLPPCTRSASLTASL